MSIDYETACLCALNTIFGFEPKIAGALLESLGSAASVFGLGEGEKETVFGPYNKYKERITDSEVRSAERMLESLADEGIVFVGKTQKGYPPRLLECPDAPVGLFVRSLSPLEEIFSREAPALGVVGTREVTPYGRQWCTDIVSAIAAATQGRSAAGAASRSSEASGANPKTNSSRAKAAAWRPVIVSGLAYGVDIIAHSSALEAGLPTIAVMATGPDAVYPSRHRDWARRIASTPRCALVTDYPPGTPPVAVNFIRRNRIIAGLSDSVILVESALKGGGMITCRMAFSYDRAVFALPGRGDDGRSQGCNHLIREGVAEIIDSLETLPQQLGLVEKGRCGLPGVFPGGFPGGSQSGFSGGSQSGFPGGRGAGGRGYRPQLPDPETVRERYCALLPGEKLSLLTSLLLKIRERSGISIDELCEEASAPRRAVCELTSLLESDGLISIDLLQRCSISGRG